jgi:L-iditol 2-dehydrogenase/threonine 3-dehydrogenase
MMYLKEDFHTAAKFLAEGKVKTKGIITKYYDVKQFKEAYEFIDANALDVMKVMLTFSK